MNNELVKVAFLRDKTPGGIHPEYEVVQLFEMHHTSLPNKGEYIHVEWDDDNASGTEVLEVIRYYTRPFRMGILTRLDRVEIKIR